MQDAPTPMACLEAELGVVRASVEGHATLQQLQDGGAAGVHQHVHRRVIVQAPAHRQRIRRVSRGLSSSPTAAIPPWAQGLEPESSAPAVSSVTEVPMSGAARAPERPARPEPTAISAVVEGLREIMS